MYNKIDRKIFEKIKALDYSKNEKLNIILHSNHYEATKKYLNQNHSDYIELPFVSCFALKAQVKDLFSLAGQDCTRYISSDTKVTSLIYESKKFMSVDNLYSKIDSVSKHSCVVIDTGVYSHIDFLLGKNRIVEFVDLINNKMSPYDDNGHGTFVCGILSGSGIVGKYEGIDNTCDIIVIKALDNDGETTSTKILQSMQWILENKEKYNIKVVCMSFGSVFGGIDDPLMRGVEVLWDNGICVVCAAGNNGPNEETIMSPGTSKKVITVGSLDNIKKEELAVADFSSRGPVGNFYKPDMVVPGVDIISTSVFKDTKKFYTKMSGTSVSAPMVAGVASLLYNIYSNYSPDQIKYKLISMCVPFNFDKNSEGFGWLNLRNLLL